jgi:hypothetical protein
MDSEFKFLLIHESNFHVTGFSYGSNTDDVVGRVSRNRRASDVADTVACRWILAATACSWIQAATVYRWILPATTSSWSSRLEFQHSSLTFRLGILATAIMGTSS